MRFNRLALPFLAVVVVGMFGCNGDTADDTPDGEGMATDSTPREVRIVQGEHGPEYPNVKFAVLSPAPNEVVKTDSVTVKVSLEGMELASPTAGEQSKGINYSKDGQHIHVIIDDKPYMAMYTPEGFSVGKLSEGMHTIRAFPSRSWHESIKAPGAFVAHTFYVQKKSGTPVLQDSMPLLTYSRPKGDYKGPDAKRVLLDFYIWNAQLAPDKYKVIASVDGQPKDTLTDWVPYYIEGLTDGAHTVKLELIGPDGKVVPGEFNSVERTININPAESATPPAGTGDTTTAAGGHDTSMKH